MSEHALSQRGGRRRSRSREAERSPVSISPPGPRPVISLGVRTKLFLASLAIIAISLLAAHAYLANTLEALLTNRIESDLSVRAELVRRDVERSHCDDLASCDAVADDLGASARARVTIVSAEGRVLGDSDVPLDRLPMVENHSQRPELVAARSSGHGVASRLSDTVHERMLYVAVPLEGARGYARVAVPLVEVDQAKAGLNQALLVGSLLALAVAAVFSFAGAQLGSKTIRHLTDVARAMAKGDFSARARLQGRDEFSSLGRALDQLAESLSITVRELSTERDLVGRILSGMQEGVLLLDDTGRIALVNPALREMLLLGEGAVGHMPIDVLQNAELAALLEPDSDLRTGEIELSGLKPRRVLVRAVPLADEPGGVLAVFVDVTDIRRLESMRKDFVANASHELRTPITAVRSAAETLRLAFESDPEAAKHFIDIIERNAERLQRLVEDLLDLSRIEARELRLALEPVDLAEFVPRALELLRERAAKKRITLSADVDRGVPPARLDRRATEQILTNLVENAIKYSPDGARVVVSAKVTGGAIRIAVSDTGPGIAERHLPRLFERFYRVDTGRSRELGGTGLGLAIVKHLVEAQGGSVGVESVVGKGSTFRMSFPVPPPEEESPAAVPVA